MTAAIEVTHLTKRYGSVTALEDVTVSIEQDSITGILGRNGAGKTVLMSLVTAQEAPTGGTIRVLGQLERVVILHHGRVREDAELDELRGRAVRLSGRGADLDQVLRGRDVLRRHDMGPVATALVAASEMIRADALAAGVDVAPASVHELVAAYGLQTDEG